MAQVVTHPKVIHQHITTQTIGGEVTINLNLTITINGDGTVAVAATPESRQDVPDSIYAIPDFDSNEVLSNFGENTGG